MNRIWLNSAKKLEFRDPMPFLKRLRKLQRRVSRSDLPSAVKDLRTNDLKDWREARETALFCVGIGQRMGHTVFLAKSESHDYDFVACWVRNDTRHFAPVQLKEVVPAELNSASSIQKTIEALPATYVDSNDLTIAIYLNQELHFDPSQLRIPRMNLAALWIFSAVAPNDSEWAIWGDFLDKPEGTRFAYPA